MAKQTERLVRKKDRGSTFEQRADNQIRKFYQTYRWRKFRQTMKERHRKKDEQRIHDLYKELSEATFGSYSRWLAGSDPLCIHCIEDGHIRSGTIADHIFRMRAGGEPYAPDNIQFLCAYHHNAKSGREANEKRQ